MRRRLQLVLLSMVLVACTEARTPTGTYACTTDLDCGSSLSCVFDAGQGYGTCQPPEPDATTDASLEDAVATAEVFDAWQLELCRDPGCAQELPDTGLELPDTGSRPDVVPDVAIVPDQGAPPDVVPDAVAAPDAVPDATPDATPDAEPDGDADTGPPPPVVPDISGGWKRTNGALHLLITQLEDGTVITSKVGEVWQNWIPETCDGTFTTDLNLQCSYYKTALGTPSLVEADLTYIPSADLLVGTWTVTAFPQLDPNATFVRYP